jgi:hypothetical protein
VHLKVPEVPAGDVDAAMAWQEILINTNIGPKVPITALPSYYSPYPSVLPRDPDARMVQYPWRYYFADIHYAPNVAFQQVLPDTFCRRRENSFWVSLSLALTGSDRFCEFLFGLLADNSLLKII